MNPGERLLNGTPAAQSNPFDNSHQQWPWSLSQQRHCASMGAMPNRRISGEQEQLLPRAAVYKDWTLCIGMDTTLVVMIHCSLAKPTSLASIGL